MKTAFFFAFLILSAISAKGQAGTVTDTTKSVGKLAGIRLEGMIGIAVNANTVALTVGGPSLKIVINENLAVGIGGFPSLFMSNERVEPKLGLSPRIDYKRFVLIAPSYHFTSPRRRWVNTVGVCYKFSR